jgi:Notch-like protein
LVSARQLCVCPEGFYGDQCENEGSPPSCADAPCQNGGECTDGEDGGYTCACPPGFIGENCEEKSATGPCFPNPCLNEGTCSPGTDGDYACACPEGFSGENCEETVVSPGSCSPNPCLNGGTCEETDDAGYYCVCPDGYSGDLCESKWSTGPCDENPCQNGGVCTETDDGYACACPEGYIGDNCDEVVIPDPCDPNPCQNEGFCLALDGGGFQCDCLEDFSGEFCEVSADPCDPSPCQNGGECSVSDAGDPTCACPEGFSGDVCEVNVACDACEAPTPGCLILDDGSTQCVACTQDAQCGDDEVCDTDTNTCSPASGPCAGNPCENGGECVINTTEPSPGCLVPEGEDTFCSDGCKEAVCAIDPFCCLFGWDETCANCAAGGEDFAGNDCSSVGNVCTGGDTYLCECPEGTVGANCEEIVVDPCAENACQNEGVCVANDEDGYTCECPEGYVGTYCEEEIPGPCDENPCLNEGTCEETDDKGYACQCAEGFVGKHCENEAGGPCDPSPCQNDGVCQVNEDGGTVCACVNGFTGEQCEAAPVDPCEPSPCVNGECSSTDDGGYACACPEGWVGVHCEKEYVDPCLDNPCQNDGSCAEVEVALCQNGCNDELCQAAVCEYDNWCCNSWDGWCAACAAGGEGFGGLDCSEVGPACKGLGAECTCVDGFTGDTCEVAPFDPCEPNPCLNGGVCGALDDGFACECVDGFTGGTCEIAPPSPCDDKPCQNDGECSETDDGYACQCKEGYTGDTCEVAPLNPCEPNPCANEGLCGASDDGFVCECVDGFTGDTCEIPPEVGPCDENPCQNKGECSEVEIPAVDACLEGKGKPGCPESEACEEAVCTLDPYCCNNTWDGICANCAQGKGVNCTEIGTVCAGGLEAACTCADGFDGDWCDNNIDDCVEDACANGGVCVDGIASFTCDCAEGYEGAACEDNIDDCDPNPCANDGVCEDGVASFTCACVEGFEGTLCDNNIDDCIDAACANGGVCLDGVAGFTCECAEGFYGLICDVLSLCTDTPCQNDGDCLEEVAQPAPSCLVGQDVGGCEESQLCQDTVCALDDYCCNAKWDGACANCAKGDEGYDGLDCSSVGYACSGGPLSFVCECVVGFTGDFCEENIDDCADDLCQNDGKCVDGVNSYTCDCPEGVSGANCENIDDPCFLEPCQNGGSCSATKTPLCQGDDCDDKLCQAAVCELDQVCCSSWDKWCAQCAAGDEGFGGADCSPAVESCTEVGYTCACPPGFDGENCEIEVEPPCSKTSVVLDGSNCIMIPTQKLSGLQSMTVEMWVRVDEFPWFFQSVLVDGLSLAGLAEAGFRVSFTNTGAYAQNIHYFESTPAGASKGFYGKNPFFEGFKEKTWTHVAIVRNPQGEGVTKVSVYVDGAYIMGPTFQDFYDDPASTDPIYVGCADKAEGTTAHFYGAIDELRISNVARYTQGFDPATILQTDANTVALYHFDDPDTPLIDASPNQLDGEWVGEAAFGNGADTLLCE